MGMWPTARVTYQYAVGGWTVVGLRRCADQADLRCPRGHHPPLWSAGGVGEISFRRKRAPANGAQADSSLRGRARAARAHERGEPGRGGRGASRGDPEDQSRGERVLHRRGREGARLGARGGARGEEAREAKPLHGVPVAIKDLTLTADIRTTFGSTLFRDHVPTEDAEVVRRLKAAGAIVLGKTNTPEFGAGANTVNKVFGATRNPWNTALSASGSTGGGAAALAARMAPLAEGSDFAGSLRTPAAFCGVVGLRTTAGLVPKHPATIPCHDQTLAGPMARSAEDCALLLDAMTGLSGKSPLSAPPPWRSARAAVAKARSLRGLRLAYAPDIAGIGVDEEIERICRTAAR